jgi:hypothetical protein
MDLTVFLTVLSGVLTYVAGQLVLKIVIEPVHELRRTIGDVSHSLIERAHIIGNPGYPPAEQIDAASGELRKHSARLHAHLYLVPLYDWTAKAFRLPSRAAILEASGNLIGLSNSIYRDRPNLEKINTKRIERICDSLGIYLPDEQRWPSGLE